MIGVPVKRSLLAYNGYSSGLGNRIRVVLGSLSLAELEQRQFFYVWPTGKLFGPNFTDLWHFSSGRTVSRATSRLLAKQWHYVDENVPTWLTESKRRELLWQVRTGSDLVLPPEAKAWTDRFRALRPVQMIADRIQSEFTQSQLRDQPYVGVMVRSHSVSHQKTLDSSPVNWFLQRMKEIRAVDPNVPFFLSCDTPETQANIMAQITGCTGLTDKGGYNTTQGVRSAVADLYLLASSAYLLGPHFSSFVELAQHLSGDRLRLETPAHGLTGPVDIEIAGTVSNPLYPHGRRAPT